MNSYGYYSSRLRQGHTPTAHGPYGAPKGNPVMKAKRITGPSANAVMNLRHTRDLEKERAKRQIQVAKDTRTAEIRAEMWWLDR